MILKSAILPILILLISFDMSFFYGCSRARDNSFSDITAVISQGDDTAKETAHDISDELGVKIDIIEIPNDQSGDLSLRLYEEYINEKKAELIITENRSDIIHLSDDLYDLKMLKGMSDDYRGFDVFDSSGEMTGAVCDIQKSGLICNRELLSSADVRLEDIHSFSDLKSCALKIHKTQGLSFDAFASMKYTDIDDIYPILDMFDSEIYYENKKSGRGAAELPDALSGEYMQNFFDLIRLMTDNCAADISTLPHVSYDPYDEFSKGHAAFFYGSDDDMKMLCEKYSMNEDSLVMIPLYFGIDDENRGFSIKCERYVSLRNDISKEEKNTSQRYISMYMKHSLPSEDDHGRSDDIPEYFSYMEKSEEYVKGIYESFLEYCTGDDHSFAYMNEACIDGYTGKNAVRTKESTKVETQKNKGSLKDQKREDN